jgi:hypothetical protein
VNDDSSVTSGFLIVLTYPSLYERYVGRYNTEKDVYAIPRIDKPSESSRVRYRGLDRDALDPLSPDTERHFIRIGKPYLLAEIRLWELESSGLSEDGFVFSLADALEVQSWLGEHASNYEIIWARIADSHEVVPDGFVSAGYEPTYFTSDHFSASCDCMLFPRWHGTDGEGSLFRDYFQRLNPHGLFDTPEEARAFLNYYLSFDWTETGEYHIAEVFLGDLPNRTEN